MKFNTIAIIGFSGVGKTALAKDLESFCPSIYNKVITSTTREKRNDEVENIDYIFKTEEEFKSGIKNNLFIEHAKYNKNYYGTPVESFKEKK